ncbi:MAG TPA: hypothetical protein VMD91_08380 [Candidatus Sulfotelmatobacter sp.]|nr:hypothetical protein [Candidatus Sulfotelmatobacter sp.]
MAPFSETLHARVTRLERGSRRDRAVVLGVVVLAMLTAQAPSSSGPQVSTTPITVTNAGGQSTTLSATGITVSDAQHRLRMVVGLDDQGRPSVDLRDAGGTLRESMYLFAGSNPTLRQFDSNSKRRLEVRLTEASNPEVQLLDPNEKLRGAFFIGASGRPQLGLYGSDERLRAYLATDDQFPFLVMNDANGQSRVNIGGFANGTIGMDVRTASNTVLWKAP